MVYMSLEIWISKFMKCPRVVDESSNELWHKTTFVLSSLSNLEWNVDNQKFNFYFHKWIIRLIYGFSKADPSI